MDNKKRIAVLVIVAIVLAATAIVLYTSDNQVSTEIPSSGETTDAGAGIVGLVIRESADIEDRGNPTGGLN